MVERRLIDMASYIHNSQTGPCFVCEIINRGPRFYDHHVLYEDDEAVVFLSKYPTLYGYTLVAPRKHREQVTGDFTLDQYLTLQRLVYLVAEAVRKQVPTERIYILSLGSQQGNRHVHWHIAPLPPGVPYEEQQLEALLLSNGIVEVSEQEMSSLAASLRLRLEFLDE